MDHCDFTIEVTAGPCGSRVNFSNATGAVAYPAAGGAGTTILNGGTLPAGDYILCFVENCCLPGAIPEAEIVDIPCPGVAGEPPEVTVNVEIDIQALIDAQLQTNVLLEQLIENTACLCGPCEEEATECEESATTHTIVNNTTDLTFSYNTTDLKIDIANDPFVSADAEPAVAAIAACIASGGEAVIDFVDQDDNAGQFTATGTGSTSPTQNLYTGIGDVSLTQSGKVKSMTVNCKCP